MPETTAKKILLVDDAPLFLELEKRLLEGRGYQLEQALSGGEAITKANVFGPDLILMDQQMPEMDGAECCRLIKSDPGLKDIPVILVTESQDLDVVRAALESGCDDFVVKPITDLVLIQKVEAVFDPTRRRRCPRMPVQFPIEFTDFEGIYAGVAEELGRGGLLLGSSNPLTKDTRLQLTFTLPSPYDKKRVQVFGRVVYVRPSRAVGSGPDMGIEFIALDRESELLIDAMVRGHLNLPEALTAAVRRTAPSAARGQDLPPDVVRRMQEILDELYHLESDKKRLITEYHDLAERFHELEAENIELARKVLETENENATLASLYVASYQLHMSLDFGSVLDTITQILVSLIGADRFVILFLSDDGKRLTPGFSCGLTPAAEPCIVADRPPISEWLEKVASARPHIGPPPGTGSADEPLALIPLAIRGDLLGVIAIFGVLGHKDGFTRLDEKLFELLSHHAATAIYCSKAYSESERKRRTFQEFIRMLTH